MNSPSCQDCHSQTVLVNFADIAFKRGENSRTQARLPVIPYPSSDALRMLFRESCERDNFQRVLIIPEEKEAFLQQLAHWDFLCLTP